ncbi:copper amine oxidase N-terminal domain-containing protein [Paenibacillus tepidiphilus]|uniref:copper amine oxidase N-terminal domain-containing protein n=1 Tax=Paenibacillus tepidiphilus TaxID=2608683 RepID=UPI0013A5AEBF|nr:copper amine oxidase N-terminal domain-containing protein [Paenibacillus tepidiphilus]
MKKLLSLLAVSVLALVLAIPAFAAEKPITVSINGSNVAFPAGTPYLSNNSVLVPFRAVFEKLGLGVLWDAKSGTVTGSGNGLTITLTVGSSRATVNGIVKKLTVAPVSKAGTTYVPLRFIAEATGGTAVWNAAGRNVVIKTPASKASDEAAIKAMIQLANKYYNEENATAFYELVDEQEDKAGAIADLENTFAAYDLKVSVDNVQVLSIEGDEASVYTEETSVRTGGYYLPDQQYSYLYTFTRTKGAWKISSVELQDSSVLLTREQGMTAAAAPQGDAAAIKDLVDKYYQNMNAENAEGVLALQTSFGEYEADYKADLLEFFNDYNFSYTLNASNIYYYTADEAAVYTEASLKDAETGESYPQTLVFIMYKANGVWKIDDYYNIGTEN